MSLAIISSRAVSGIHAAPVSVEVHLSYGIAKFHIVGLPETAVKESRDRVRSALLNSKFDFPIRLITVNLAPADIPKEGGGFDLAIAIGILAASKQIPMHMLNDYEFTGELALSGELRAVRGVLPMALAAYRNHRSLIAPRANEKEAAFVKQATVLTATHLLDVCSHLYGKTSLPQVKEMQLAENISHEKNLSDVKGQAQAKRALEIAAAGGHSLLLIGPPGTGKTMLATRLTTLLPNLNEEESLEVAAIASISQQGFDVNKWRKIPFRSPHHTASYAALVGGGRPPKPGEISLAHKGILFLDELPEFKRVVLECLREPLESGEITISRAAWQSIFPAEFQLIAAMNPCPCGYASGAMSECLCSADQIKRYLAKLSGPLLDRIDMQVAVNAIPKAILAASNQQEESSDIIKERVIRAREYQIHRQGKLNARLSAKHLEASEIMEESAKTTLMNIMEKFQFSARSYHRFIKIARTIADLEQAEIIRDKHIAETLNYRCLDKATTR